MSAPSNLILSSQLLREGEDTIQRHCDLIERMRKDGQPIRDAKIALDLMEAAMVSMRLQHAVAVAATRPTPSSNLH